MLLRSAYSGQANSCAKSMVPMRGFCQGMLSALSSLSAEQTAKFGNAAELSKVQHMRHFFTTVERMLRSVFEC